MDFLINCADIEEQYRKYKQLKREDIAKLAEWQDNQPHLPSTFHPIETALFLHSASYSIEAAKQRIDAYYTFRTHHPDIFTLRDPLAPEIQLGLNTILITVLPKVTPEGHMVVYGQFLDYNPKSFNLNTLWKLIDLISLLSLLQRGSETGIVSVVNLKGLTMTHLLKSTVNTVKNILVYLQIASPVHIEAIHFVNCGTFADKILALLKPFLGKKHKDKLHAHLGNNATIFKYFSKDLLPTECGGTSASAKDYFTNVTRKELESHAEFLEMFARRVVDESKRPGKPKYDVDFFGVDGTFNKLDID